jgi:hypothetical protein
LIDHSKRSRAWLLAVCAVMSALLPLATPSVAGEARPVWDVLREGTTGRTAVVLFRHARAPGTGDPPGFKIGDCATQRNLDEAGRAQARRIGQAFQSEGFRVGLVLASQWCRATQTAELAFPGLVTPEPAFNSFFDTPERGDDQTQEARAILAWTRHACRRHASGQYHSAHWSCAARW